MNPTWTCAACGEPVPLDVATERKDAGTLAVTLDETALANVFAHVWSEHGDRLDP